MKFSYMLLTCCLLACQVPQTQEPVTPRASAAAPEPSPLPPSSPVPPRPNPTPEPAGSPQPTPGTQFSAMPSPSPSPTARPRPSGKPEAFVSTLKIVKDYPLAEGESEAFDTPSNIAIDKTRNILYVDNQYPRIYKLQKSSDEVWHATVLAGATERGYVDALGEDARFSLIMSMETDQAGNLYVVDDRVRIRKITPQGEVTTIAGSGKKGYRDGPALEASLNTLGIGMDKNKNQIFLADADYIRNLNLTQHAIHTIAGQQQWGFLDGDLSIATIGGPYDIQISSKGDILFNEQMNCIRKIEGNILKTIAGVCEETDQIQDGPGHHARFGNTARLDIDSYNYLFVVENQYGRIRQVAPDGYVTTIAGQLNTCEPLFNKPFDTLYQDGPGDEAIFYCPLDIAVSADDKTLYVTDTGNDAIRKITLRYPEP